MLVDGGASVNLMPWNTCKKLSVQAEELVKTNMVLSDFMGGPTEAKGVLVAELAVGSKVLPTTFFVVDAKGSYSVLLGRDWIHANCCVPSTMHQVLIQWNEDDVEIIRADTVATVNMAGPEANWPYEEARCLSRTTLGEADFVSVGKQGFTLVQREPIAIDRAEISHTRCSRQ